MIWGLIGLWVGRDWGFGFVAIAWLALALNEPLNTAIHEAGHAIAVRLMGFSLLSVRIGRGPEILHARLGLARISLRRYAMLGGDTRYLKPDDAARWRQIVSFWPGPSPIWSPLASWARWAWSWTINPIPGRAREPRSSSAC